MAKNPNDIPIYHIAHVERLPTILTESGLLSDAELQRRAGDICDEGIGYTHIKRRRLTEITVDCCGGRFVGEFVPFYFCPRSPMLYTVNQGQTGYPSGCQNKIVHLVSSMAAGMALDRDWAFSDGNAGAYHALFYRDFARLDELDWEAIRAVDWQGKTHQKMAEFLVAEAFPWIAVTQIGCHNQQVAAEVRGLLEKHLPEGHHPPVEVKPAGYDAKAWYY